MLRDVCVITPTVVTLLKAYETFSAIERRQKCVEFEQLFLLRKDTTNFFFSPHDQNPKFKARTREHFFFFLSRWHPRGPFLRRLFISLVLDIIFIIFITAIKLLKLFVVSTRARDSF